ncbi:MAG TPA: hypothetical protein VGE52_02265, partial [Pirellulales bacterium]
TAPVTPALTAALTPARNASMKKPTELAAVQLPEPPVGFSGAPQAEATAEPTAPAVTPAPATPAESAPAASAPPAAPAPAPAAAPASPQ